MPEETNQRGLTYTYLMTMRCGRPEGTLWQTDLYMLEEYANYPSTRVILEIVHPAIKELPA